MIANNLFSIDGSWLFDFCNHTKLCMGNSFTYNPIISNHFDDAYTSSRRFSTMRDGICTIWTRFPVLNLPFHYNKFSSSIFSKMALTKECILFFTYWNPSFDFYHNFSSLSVASVVIVVMMWLTCSSAIGAVLLSSPCSYLHLILVYSNYWCVTYPNFVK